MRSKQKSLFLMWFFALALVSCQRETSALSDQTLQMTSSPTSTGMVIQATAFNYFSSGLPTRLPSVAIIANGTIQAFHDGSQNPGDALSAIAAGEFVPDEEERRLQMQTGLDGFLASENITFAALADSQENVVVLFSPGKSLGECPPCESLFSPFKAGTMLGNFKIKKVILEHH